MPRADEGLAFLLRYENVAWYEDGKVRILDRRCYPHPIKFVTCNTSEEVANAILFLGSDLASYCTATCLSVDGWTT